MVLRREVFAISALACAILATAAGQTAYAQTAEFDVASIRVNPPAAGFHFAADSSSGGPGTSDPGMFRCSKCTLATLIGKAFNLRNYQFPAMASLADNTFEVAATIPAGATAEAFQSMLQNLLKERFSLAFRYTEKKMRGYHLVLARNGSKLRESSDTPEPAADNPNDQRQHGNAERYGHSDGGAHNGLISFNGLARYRGDHKTAADLARLFSDQLSLPVNDETGLQGKYDVSLTWGDNTVHSGNHADGGWGGGGHADHGRGAAAAPSGSGSISGDASGPSLFDAVQAQLGLRLVPAEQVVTRIFVIDHVQPLPTAN